MQIVEIKLFNNFTKRKKDVKKRRKKKRRKNLSSVEGTNTRTRSVTFFAQLKILIN